MKPYRLIGITGGIATGKSTVSKYIRSKGLPLIDADEISRSMYEKGSRVYRESLEYFGQEILDENLEVNRKYLGDLVFSSREKLEALNKISHSYIFSKIREEVLERDPSSGPIFIDIPLLLETRDRLEEEGLVFQAIILVYVDYPTQLERLMKRDGLGLGEAEKRIAAQMDMERKRGLASHIVDNSGDLEDLKLQVDRILEEIV